MPGSLLHLDLSLLFFLFLLLVFLEFDSFEFCVFLGYFVISHFFPHFDVFFIRRCFMTYPQTLRCLVDHLPLKRSSIVNCYFPPHLLEYFRKMPPHLDLLLRTMLSHHALHLLLLLILIIYQLLVFLLFLLLHLTLLHTLASLLCFLKELYLIAGSHSESHILLSPKILSTGDVAMLFDPLNKRPDMFIHGHTLNITNKNKHPACASDCHIHPPPIPQKPNFPLRIAPDHRYNNTFLFSTLDAIDCGDIDGRQSLLADQRFYQGNLFGIGSQDGHVLGFHSVTYHFFIDGDR